MIRLNRMKSALAWGVPVAVLGLLGACSTDSPTAPVQQPIPPSGGASAVWNVSVSVSPREVEVGSQDPVNVTVDVRRADNNQRPASGTTLVLSTNLGDFNAPNSGLQSVAVITVNGQGGALWFPGALKGNAVFVAQLESSAGQSTASIVDVIEPVVAGFSTQNSESNLSVQFQDTSSGDPTSWLWDFGDGATSKEQHPAHLYALPGDYVVTLTASKKSSSDTTSQLVNVTRDPENEVAASFEFAADQLRVVFQDTSTGNPTNWLWTFGDGSQSTLQHPVKVYAAEGSYVVTLTASNADGEDTTSQIITLSLDDPEEPNLFISDITPNSGPAAGGTVVTITGIGFTKPLRVLFGGVLGAVTSSTSTTITVTTPPGDLDTGPCNVNADAIIGEAFVDTPVVVSVELGAGGATSVAGGFTYLAPAVGPANPCLGD